jgi:hypothetical protein
MPDPVLLAIASAVAAKGVEAVADGGRGAITALTRLVRDRLGRGARDRAALADAVAHPDDAQRCERLASVLADVASLDPAFGERLRATWAAVSTGSDGVVNQISGRVGGHVVQARDVRGDISF